VKRRLIRHVGNRGIVLATLGLIWIVMGTVVHPDSPEPVLLHERFHLWVTLLMWSLPGAIAVAAAVRRQLDPTAWGVLFVGPGIRLASYTWGLITGVYWPGWKGLVVWLAVCVLINRCASGLDRAAPWDGKERRRWTQEPGQ
jgi:hypothetical protein